MKDCISVLICTRDRRDMLDLLLIDLHLQDYRGRVEIIVVEETDAPRPPSGVVYVSHPVRNKGIPYARNLALQHAEHEIVIFVDDDCRMDKDWLRCLIAPFADKEVQGVQGGVTVQEGAGAVGWAESLLGFPGGGISRVHHAAGHVQPAVEISTLNAAYRRYAIEQAGGFPEAARYGGEDYVLAKRMAEHGRLVYAPQALVRHAVRGSFPDVWRWFIRRGRAEVGLLCAGIAPKGYARRLLRASLSLKLVFALLLVPWLGLWPIALLLAMSVVATWWRLRWALRDPTVPAAGFWIAPVVRLIMDLAGDAGRLSEWRSSP